MTNNLKDIPPLLHDARLSDCRWDGHLKTLELSFQCLRRNVDGTPIEDSTVDLKLGGVERVVAHYSPASVTVKPGAQWGHSTFPVSLDPAFRSPRKSRMSPFFPRKSRMSPFFPETLAACNEHGMAMLLTGRRHFRH